ncbi:solute:Na+ symporter [Parelusimicrobium proximum]|uniref:sodium:solute symporter family protein n=1 Tax=Parelusimicrobium proximum TaxID=3228953 RepID=UPI003D17F3F4
MTFSAAPNIFDHVKALDWVVFSVILFFTFGAGVAAYFLHKKGNNKILDYMLMGRRLTLPLFIATLTTTWYGGIFGVNEITFNYGIYNFFTQGVFWYVVYIILALFIVDKISKFKVFTLPELVGEMFGKGASYTAAVFTFFYILPISYALSLGVFLHMVFGISVLKGMILGTLFACTYSALGGFRAVVFSEVIQFIVMCSAVAMVLLFSLYNFGGLEFLKANLPASHFSITGGQGVLNTLIWGFIALATLVDPSFYQRCFAAESPKTAKRGILICTAIWFCFDICTTAGALYARALIPEAEASNAYFYYAVQMLPVGLKGFFIAGILAIILSTLDSFMFIASNTLSYDFLRKIFKNVVLVSRINMFIVGAIAIFMATLFKGSFKAIWLTMGSYMAACMLVPILIGYIKPGKINSVMFNISSISAAVFMTVWSLSGRTGFWAEVDGFYIGVLTSVIMLSVMIIYKGVRNEKSINNM